MFPADNFLSPIFSFNFGACYITAQWGEFRVKNATLCMHVPFLLFFKFFYMFLFFYIYLSFYAFLLFSFFFHKVSNFRNRTSTSQKPKLAIRNFQWNCVIHNSHFLILFLKTSISSIFCVIRNNVPNFCNLRDLIPKFSELLLGRTESV